MCFNGENITFCSYIPLKEEALGFQQMYKPNCMKLDIKVMGGGIKSILADISVPACHGGTVVSTVAS